MVAKVSYLDSYSNRMKKQIGKMPSMSGASLGVQNSKAGITPLSVTNNSPVPPSLIPNSGYKPLLQQAETFNVDPVPVGDKSLYRGQYNVLSAVDGMGESALNKSNAELQAENARRARDNSLLSSQPSFGAEGGDFSFDGLDAEQSKYANEIMRIGKSRGLNDDDITIAIMTALAESGLRNLNYGDRDSVGLFQQRTSQGWGTIQQIMDHNYSINKFYDAYMPARGGHANPWQVAQNVQRSAFADGSNYRAQYAKAQAIVRAAANGGAQSAGGIQNVNAASSFIKQYNGKYIDFDGAYGNQCVDLFNYYNQAFGTGNFIGGIVGAKDIWNSRQMDSAYRRLSATARPNMGDVVVYGASQGGGYGHVAVVVGVNANGTLRLLHSNAGPQGSRGATAISDLSRAGVLGYFRPNRLVK